MKKEISEVGFVTVIFGVAAWIVVLATLLSSAL